MLRSYVRICTYINVDIEVLPPCCLDDEVGCSIPTATIKEVNKVLEVFRHVSDYDAIFCNGHRKWIEPITGFSYTR